MRTASFRPGGRIADQDLHPTCMRNRCGRYSVSVSECIGDMPRPRRYAPGGGACRPGGEGNVSIQFTRNYRDLSTDKGYQFEFYCDRCGSGHRTTFKATAGGVVSDLL